MRASCILTAVVIATGAHALEQPTQSRRETLTPLAMASSNATISIAPETANVLRHPSATLRQVLPLELACEACDLFLPERASPDAQCRLSIAAGPSVDVGGIVVTVVTGITGEVRLDERHVFLVEQANFGVHFAKLNYDPARDRLGLFLPIALRESSDAPPHVAVLLGEITSLSVAPRVGALRLGFQDIVSRWFPGNPAFAGAAPTANPRRTIERSAVAAASSKPGLRCCSGAFMCKCCEGEFCFVGACAHQSCSSCLTNGCSECQFIGCPMTCSCGDDLE